MAVFRVSKTKDYTVMSNTHLKEKEMSLKAKGLLSVMLSLPDEWDYSINGLCAICKENETAIKSTLNELKKFGYLTVKKMMPNETATGRIEYEYHIFERPQAQEKQGTEKQEVEKQGVENLPLEFQGVENPGQLNTQLLNTKEENTQELNTKKEKKEVRHKYGEYSNVLLSDTELAKLKNEFPVDYERRIESLSSYMASTGKSYKNHLATIRNWARRDKEKRQQAKPQQQQSTSFNPFRDLVMELEAQERGELPQGDIINYEDILEVDYEID